MDNRKLGAILLLIGIILASATLIIKIQEDSFIKKFEAENGTCYLDDVTCLHEQQQIAFYGIAWVFSAILIALGAYLMFFEKSQQEIITTLERQKHLQSEDEKFNILLKGLNEEEQKVLKAVKEQDGITQQTLRLRTDLHKSKLSILLEQLEKKDLITRQDKGKTKEVFLKINL